MEPNIPTLLSIKQVATALGVSRRTVADLITAGQLHSLKLTDAPNASVRIRLDEFEDYLDRRALAMARKQASRSTGFTSPEAVA